MTGVSNLSSYICAAEALEYGMKGLMENNPNAASFNLALAAILGLSSVKILPGAATASAALFVTQAILRKGDHNMGPLEACIGEAGYHICSKTTDYLIKPVFKNVVKPLAQNVILPVANKVAEVIRKIKLPMNEMWYVAAGLAVAGGAYRLIEKGRTS